MHLRGFLYYFNTLWITLWLLKCTAVSSASVTNEDIRDAILQIVNMIRATEDKLERHEYRERVLGEQLKKGMISIDKRIKLLDPSRGPITRLDQRLAAVETILIQKDEKEKAKLQSTFEAVNDIQKNLPIIVDKLKQDILQKISEYHNASHVPNTKINNDMAASVRDILDDKIKVVIELINNAKDGLEDNFFKYTNSNKTIERLDSITNQLAHIDQTVNTSSVAITNITNTVVRRANEEKKYANAIEALSSQNAELKKTQINILNAVLNKSHTNPAQNSSVNAIVDDVKDEIKRSYEMFSNAWMQSVNNLHQQAIIMHNETQVSLLNLSKSAGNLSDAFIDSYGQIRSELQNLGRVEQVMVQTADVVLDTKRRVEYGVHQILAEVGNLIRTSSKEINSAIDHRFSNFETTILDEENGALANLTSSIGEEIDQVWRQIGIMHQQITATGDTINKLQNQTDVYVNGSLNAMDNMKNKVGKITSRITEVDENLNYLLGKLSLVTQEFNQIKTGLGKALDEIRGTFKSVELSMKDTGPGPHNITSNETTDQN